ncbi:DUF927 domain-containing protein [Nitrosomonas sp.]|uniref:DUF927 domain-containing protein n=1 Tax=Nitrosomonas sp. TaxID=42353 RepID=UPI00374CDFC3
MTIAPKSRQLVIEYLQTQSPEKRTRITNRTGWHGVDDEPIVFVLPDGSIGQSDDDWLYSVIVNRIPVYSDSVAR